MQNRQILITLLTTLFIGGCSNLATTNFQSESQLAKLTSYQLDNGFIEIETIGYGCTFQHDFKVEAVNDSDNTIEIIRTRPDNCKMAPRNVALSYSFKHLDLDSTKPIKVLNQVNNPAQVNFAAR